MDPPPYNKDIPIRHRKNRTQSPTNKSGERNWSKNHNLITSHLCKLVITSLTDIASCRIDMICSTFRARSSVQTPNFMSLVIFWFAHGTVPVIGIRFSFKSLSQGTILTRHDKWYELGQPSHKRSVSSLISLHILHRSSFSMAISSQYFWQSGH